MPRRRSNKISSVAHARSMRKMSSKEAKRFYAGYRKPSKRQK